MEEKETLVEQIAKAICPIIQPLQCRELCTNVGNCQELKEVCRKIVNGFSKHDTAVVLTREEYEEYQDLLKNFDNYLFEYRKFADGCIKDKGKETAEKILFKVYSKLTEPSTWKQMHTWWLYNGECEQLKALLNEIAISEGVEIKE